MARPHTLLLDITERCNLRCVMCHFAAVERIRVPPFDETPDNGNMPVGLFERIAGGFFPRARRVSLSCAAEPLMHPRFAEIISIAGRYGVPDLWFPTNLIPLTTSVADAIVRSNVTTIAVSIDGVRKATYEAIRAGATWERLMAKLDLLRSAFRSVRKPPRLRIIFTWMRANRDELRELPRFAARVGARELDVRYVVPPIGVDIAAQSLRDEDPARMRADLEATARDAEGRGLRLAAFPHFDGRPRSLASRIRGRASALRIGSAPAEHYVIRPSGAVFPCQHSDQPVGFASSQSLSMISGSRKMADVRERRRTVRPAGACTSCGTTRDAFYQSLSG
jgi:MoaA/NifB/PqqE/SkfB family radical SAM enzyme